MWIWVDVFSAGIKPGTCRLTRFLECLAVHYWATKTDESPKIPQDPCKSQYGNISAYTTWLNYWFYRNKSSPRIYQFIFTHRFSPTHFHPLIFTHAFSPTCFHPPVLTHLFSPQKVGEKWKVTPRANWNVFFLPLFRVGWKKTFSYWWVKTKFHSPKWVKTQMVFWMKTLFCAQPSTPASDITWSISWLFDMRATEERLAQRLFATRITSQIETFHKFDRWKNDR